MARLTEVQVPERRGRKADVDTELVEEFVSAQSDVWLSDQTEYPNRSRAQYRVNLMREHVGKALGIEKSKLADSMETKVFPTNEDDDNSPFVWAMMKKAGIAAE